MIQARSMDWSKILLGQRVWQWMHASENKNETEVEVVVNNGNWPVTCAALYSLVNWAHKNKACFNTTEHRINHFGTRNVYRTRKRGDYTLECNGIIRDGFMNMKFLNNTAVKRSSNPYQPYTEAQSSRSWKMWLLLFTASARHVLQSCF